jgi:hypothetical protein
VQAFQVLTNMGSIQDMRQTPLSTVDDLVRLPRWALIAFGVRTARRLVNAAKTYHDELGNFAVNKTLELAEKSASQATILNINDEILLCKEAAGRTYQQLSSWGDGSDYIREFCAPAHVAEMIPVCVEKNDVQLIRHIIDDVIYVGPDCIEENINQDLLSICQAAHVYKWDDDTPVNQHFFNINFKIPEIALNIIRAMSDQIARLIASAPQALNEIEWRDLERLMAVVFEGLGCEVELTPSSKDGGKDIILKIPFEDDVKNYIVEIKHWRSQKLVGSKPLADFVHVIAHEQRDGGIFYASSGYSTKEVEVMTEIDRGVVYLGAEKHIVSLCRSYVKASDGLWSLSPCIHEILPRDYDQLKTIPIIAYT